MANGIELHLLSGKKLLFMCVCLEKIFFKICNNEKIPIKYCIKITFCIYLNTSNRDIIVPLEILFYIQILQLDALL